MNVTNCIQKVPDDEGSGLLRKSLSVLDDIVKLSAFTQLQNRVKVVLVVEKSIHFGDVRMLQKRLDFQLPDKLGQKILFDYSLLLYGFNRYHKAALFLHR